MERRGALERCETGANPLETRGKRKPVTPENDPRETGLSFLNGGGGGNRTRVREQATVTSTSVGLGCFSYCKGGPRPGALQPAFLRLSPDAKSDYREQSEIFLSNYYSYQTSE